MTSEERRTIKNWAARLGAPDEALTLEEVEAFAAIAACDRLLELLTALQDVQARLTRLELYLAETVPGYQERSTRRLRLADGARPS